MLHAIHFLVLLMALSGCSSLEESQQAKVKERNERRDLVHRSSHEVQYVKQPLVQKARDLYPWETGYEGAHPRITSEFFRCKGNSLNPPREQEGDKNLLFHDCGGSRKHSLPVRDGKEFVYPILLDLLNYLQVKTGCPVVITSGHRCPDHHKYVDSSTYNSNSKHMIGAEVDFYVKGYEEKPQAVLDLLMQYYKEKSPYKGQKEYENFLRLEKVNVSTPPWYNKEVMLKLYLSQEGRNLDNGHSHPYISIQVRFDRDKQEKVLYSWEKAWGGYMRY